jgi:hypothetical protein
MKKTSEQLKAERKEIIKQMREKLNDLKLRENFKQVASAQTELQLDYGLNDKITELPAGYGQNNKLFTRAKYLQAKQKIKIQFGTLNENELATAIQIMKSGTPKRVIGGNSYSEEEYNKLFSTLRELSIEDLIELFIEAKLGWEENTDKQRTENYSESADEVSDVVKFLFERQIKKQS